MRKLIVFLTPALIILAGILVVKYREDMVTWMTIGLGAIFFMAGVISCISYYIQRKHVQKIREKIADGISLMDANGNVVEQSMPTFPIVGIGSLVLGIVLASMPETFLNGLTFIFAVIILLSSVYLIADLIMVWTYLYICCYHFACICISYCRSDNGKPLWQSRVGLLDYANLDASWCHCCACSSCYNSIFPIVLPRMGNDNKRFGDDCQYAKDIYCS